MPVRNKVGFFRTIGQSIDDKYTTSVNSIAVLVSVAIGSLIGLTVCFVLIYDVVTNGYVKTDMIDMAIFLLASGGYILGSGIPKTIVDTKINSHLRLKKDKTMIDGKEYAEDTEEEEIEEEEK